MCTGRETLTGLILQFQDFGVENMSSADEKKKSKAVQQKKDPYSLQVIENENAATNDGPWFFDPAPPTSTATGEYPSMEEFAGEYDFQMSLTALPLNPGGRVECRRSSYQYSEILKKVFMTEARSVPIMFKVAPNHPPLLYVRAVAVYVDPNSATIPVLRCPTHCQNVSDRINQGYTHLDHVVSSSQHTAVYEVDRVTKRRSVSVHLKGPQPGTCWETIMFAMMCRSSCPNGIGRRPLALVFTLEQYYQVLGRRVLYVRVCASPHRDCQTEEARLIKNDPPPFPSDMLNVVMDLSTQTEGPFFVPVTSREDYITLARDALHMVNTDYPDGPEKQQEIERYTNIVSQVPGFNLNYFANN